MTDQFVDANKMVPITPPPELVQQWMRVNNMDIAPFHLAQTLATQAARWGANQELEACCEWLSNRSSLTEILRSARRPKPPSLKEQALGALYAIATGADDTREFHQDLETIKTALKSLPD